MEDEHLLDREIDENFAEFDSVELEPDFDFYWEEDSE